MNSFGYKREFKHPYAENKKGNHTHLQLTTFDVPPFTAFAVPFWWMLRKNKSIVDSEYPDLPKDETPPFATSWVYGSERQRALLETVFKQVEAKKSLVFFYTKSGNPLDEEIPRLLVGIGRIETVGSLLLYKRSEGTEYALWDRMITHSIRTEPKGGDAKGFLIPYHEYLQLAEDFSVEVGGKKMGKEELLDEIKFSLVDAGEDESRLETFSNGSELVANLQAVAVLLKARKVIERITEHGIVPGPWDQRLTWIGDQIGIIKDSMGPFPAFSSALVVLGFKNGHLFTQDLYEEKKCGGKDDPWNALDRLLMEPGSFAQKSYAGELVSLKEILAGLGEKDSNLIKMLSRMELNVKQIERWFNPDQRKKRGFDITPAEILENPYILAEQDAGDNYSSPIVVETVDSAVFEDRAIQGNNAPESPYRVDSDSDRRRIRAIVIQLLKAAAAAGDTLLSGLEIRQRMERLGLARPAKVVHTFFDTHKLFFEEKLTSIHTENIEAWQLKLYEEIENSLRKKLIARACKELPSLGEDWQKLVIEAVSDFGGKIDLKNSRHVAALHDQTVALEKITTRKLSVLHGPAGTGKTSVMGALFRSEKVMKDGILLLAPTGKARVRLGNMAKSEAFTVAQFLTKQGRFDWSQMRPRFVGKEKYKGERTVVVDECSMLTEEDLHALLEAIDLAHVERVILVGDPYQLPPIGPGRPFADLCAYLDEPIDTEADADRAKAAGAMARLEVIVRSTRVGESDTLLLASWFAGRKPPKNADTIFEKMGDNSLLNDLRIELWKNEEEILPQLNRVLIETLGLKDEKDSESFSKALGVEDGLFPLENPNVIENFQLLSPVRQKPWGTFPINRFIQGSYRKRDFRNWENPFGTQQIWWGDKIIQLINERRDGYNPKKKESSEAQLSNGQLGYVCHIKKGFLNAAFSGNPGYWFGYRASDFVEDGSSLELAYIITIHKSQGSDFKIVFLILPQKSRLLSRELLYTALTRSKDRLIVLLEGENPMWVFDYSKGEASETARRNTHLFKTSIRESITDIPFIQNLIHKTKNGIFVRSKSEVIVANLLHDAEIEFEYERRFETKGGWRLPDFTFVDAGGEKIILEHLGMLHKPSYREDWEKKRAFYLSNGFVEGENLFTTNEDENGAIDSKRINDTVIPAIKSKL